MIAKKIQKKSLQLRKRILDLSLNVPALHVGGSFSSAELIQTIFEIKNNKRDKFILSKGHAGILLYSILEQKGLIKKKDLDNYCKKDGFLGVHPEIYINGVEASTGSLGHGLGIAAGMSLSKKYKNIYVLCSDGELMEGSIWESVLMISSFKLNNIILLVDNNDLQSATRATDTHPSLYPIKNKFRSFGWDSHDCNGHDPVSILKILKKKKLKNHYVWLLKQLKDIR